MWRGCMAKANERFWHLHLQRLASPESIPATPPFSQWNTGDFRCTWLPQVDGLMPDVEVGPQHHIVSLLSMPCRIPLLLLRVL